MVRVEFLNRNIRLKEKLNIMLIKYFLLSELILQRLKDYLAIESIKACINVSLNLILFFKRIFFISFLILIHFVLRIALINFNSQFFLIFIHLTLTRLIGLPPHAPVAQKIADRRWHIVIRQKRYVFYIKWCD